MQIFIYIIIGVAGGVLGGMGMGGGTLLIPLLTLCTGMPQHLAQSINLAAFIPMSLITLIIHTKNKLVKYKYLLLISLPAVGSSILGSFFTKRVGGRALSKYFGIFLALLGAYQLITLIISCVRDRKNKSERQKRIAVITEKTTVKTTRSIKKELDAENARQEE